MSGPVDLDTWPLRRVLVLSNRPLTRRGRLPVTAVLECGHQRTIYIHPTAGDVVDGAFGVLGEWRCSECAPPPPVDAFTNNDRLPLSAAVRINGIRRVYDTGEPVTPTDVRDLLDVVDHVVDVLRDAKRNNGGYGFVLHLLQYLAGEATA